MEELIRMHELVHELHKEWMQSPIDADKRNAYLTELEISYEFLYNCWMRKLEDEQRIY